MIGSIEIKFDQNLTAFHFVQPKVVGKLFSSMEVLVNQMLDMKIYAGRSNLQKQLFIIETDHI